MSGLQYSPLDTNFTAGAFPLGLLTGRPWPSFLAMNSLSLTGPLRVNVEFPS